MMALGQLLHLLLDLYLYVIIASVVASWLIAFEVINIRNPQAANLMRLLNKITEPVFKPLRKYIPPIGGMDLTPLVVILGIYILQSIVFKIFMNPYGI